MLPILITILVTAPILAIGTWLYLRRRSLRPSVRIALMLILFLFVLVSGPAIMWMWLHGGTTREIASTGSGGGKFLGQLPLLWLLEVLGIGAALVSLCRNKGQL